MFITKLDVVNGALAAAWGESGLTDLEEDHAYKAIILQYLNEELDRICARGWWFNQEVTHLEPDADSKFIYVPTDIYSVVTPRRGFSAAQLGRRMYDAACRTYEWTKPLPVRLTRKFPFEDLPFNAQAAIRDCAIAKFLGNIDSDREKKADAAQAARLTGEELVRIDLQNQKHNMMYRNGMEFNAWLAVGQSFDERQPLGPNILVH